MIARLASVLLAALLFAVLTWALFSFPPESPGLQGEAYEALDRSGVSNPVTAVLLNYRGYDTLLEVAVLLLAIVAVWSLRAEFVEAFDAPAGPVLPSLLRFLVPLLVLAGGYVLWIGSFAPGGAFQGGALLGGALVLMFLGGRVGRRAFQQMGLCRAGLGLGLAVFIGVGLGVMLGERPLMEYPKKQAGTLILMIETAALISIALTLGALFFGGRPVSEKEAKPKGNR